MNIIDESYKQMMQESNKEFSLELTDYECDCYANCFKILNELSNNKLSFENIFITYDFFDDVTKCKKPEIMLMGENKYFDMYRLSKRYSLTKNLNDEERKVFVFALYYAICIFGMDEKTKQIKWSLEEFTSREAIESLYKEYLNEQSEKFTIPEIISDYTKPNYGLNEENPIEVNGVGTIYDYLECLEMSDGSQVKFNREGSLSNSKGIMIDKFNVFKKSFFGIKKKVSDIYISGYGFENSEHVPDGFKFKGR